MNSYNLAFQRLNSLAIVELDFYRASLSIFSLSAICEDQGTPGVCYSICQVLAVAGGSSTPIDLVLYFYLVLTTLSDWGQGTEWSGATPQFVAD